jgi:putative acetyltransferase
LSINIRLEKSSDIQSIHQVTVAAFLDAPHTDHTEQYIVKALRNSGALTISLVAEDSNQIIGHVAVSPRYDLRWIAGLVWFGANIR